MSAANASSTSLFDRMIEDLHAGRDARREFNRRCRFEVDALARAVETRLGAPEGAVHVLDRNGVGGSDAVIVCDETPGRIQFTLSMPIEHDLDMLADPRISVERVPHQSHVSIDVAGNLVPAACLTDARCVDAVCVALQRIVADEAGKWLPSAIGGADATQQCGDDASARAGDAPSSGDSTQKRSVAASMLRAAMPSLLQR